MKNLALFIAIAALLPAQTPDSEKKLEFEVASIHPATQDNNHSTNSDNALLRIHNLTLKRLIVFAYDIDMRQIVGGPPWLDSDSFDISAAIPPEFVKATGDAVARMMRSLLADRFQLAFHREPGEISGYELVVGKKGPKMDAAKQTDKGSGMHTNNTHLKANNVTMPGFAKYLSGNRDIDKLVVDKTALTGGFDFELEWTPDGLGTKSETAADDHPSIFTALQQTLGLKLNSAKVPMLTVVIDRAEKPAGN